MTPALTVYIFFATWCVPCRQEMPQIAHLAAAWRERNVRFVLVSEDAPSTAGNVPAFLARYGVDAEVVLDTESALLERYNPSASLPFTVVIDAAGRIVYSHSGYQPGDEKNLEAALAGATAPPPRAYTTEATLQTLGVRRSDDFRGLGDPRLDGGLQRVDLLGQAGWARATLRIDGALVEAPAGDQRDLRVEKAALEARLGPLRLLAGDGYAAFGQGLTLSVRKIDPLGVDTSIRGGRADVRAGFFGATVLAGILNPQNTDPIELRTVADPGDRIAGVEMRQEVGATVRLGQSAVVARMPGAAPDGRTVDHGLGGLSLAIRRDRIRGALDVAALGVQGLGLGDERQTGHGAAATLGFDVRDFTFVAEGKSYRRFVLGRPMPVLAYHEPPTLEREDQELPGNADSLGARGRVEWRARPTTTLYGSGMAYRFTNDGTAALNGGLAAHGYAGAEQRFASGASIGGSAGFRRETLPDGSEKLRFVQATVDAAVALPRRFGLTAKWDHRSETKLASLGPYDFVKGLAVVGASWAGRITLSGLYGYSTEATARPVHYPGGELRVAFGRHGDARLFAGRITGGRVCVSGACRDVPPFEGARVDVALRF